MAFGGRGYVQPPGLVGSSHVIDANAAPYNATPDAIAGVGTGAEVAIQAAIDAAAAQATAGTPYEVVVWKPGTYTLDLHTIPNQSSVAAHVWLRSFVKLNAGPGVVFKLKASATLPDTTTKAHAFSNLTPFTSSASNVHQDMEYEGIVYDGNAANQTGLVIQAAMFFGASKNCRRFRCKVNNVYGNDTSPPGETFFYDDHSCVDAVSLLCEADGSGSANTATGFSANNSYGSLWAECRSHDMGVAMGFTHWQCAGLKYIGCHAYRNGWSGFNSERSEGITYTACISGGRSPMTGTTVLPFFQSGQVTLGNTHGWTIQGSSRVTIDASCQGAYNATYGCSVKTNTAAPGGGTIAISGNTTNASAVVTGISSTAGLQRGMGVTGSGIPANAIVQTIDSATQITLNTNATATASGVALTLDAYRASVGVRVLGSFRFNGTNNVFVDDTSHFQIDTLVEGDITDTIDDAIAIEARSPIYMVRDRGNGSGFRISVKTAGTTNLFRLQNTNTSRSPLTVTVNDQVATLGRRISRRVVNGGSLTLQDELVIVNDGANHSLGLPSAATAGAGAIIRVKDEGALGANTITLTPSGSDTVESGTLTGTGAFKAWYSDGVSKWFRLI